jgi:hypothetical protein
MDVFKAALNGLVQRHEVFQYSFQHGSSGVFISVTDVVDVPIKLMEVSILLFYLFKIALQTLIHFFSFYNLGWTYKTRN